MFITRKGYLLYKLGLCFFQQSSRQESVLICSIYGENYDIDPWERIDFGVLFQTRRDICCIYWVFFSGVQNKNGYLFYICGENNKYPTR